MYNEIVEKFFVQRKCDFPKSTAEAEGSYIAQVHALFV